jgi:hypothetical protein
MHRHFAYGAYQSTVVFQRAFLAGSKNSLALHGTDVTLEVNLAGRP